MTLFLADAAQTAPTLAINVGDLTEPSGMSTVVKIAVIMTALTVLPSIMVMFTSFVRLIIVFHFIRQAMGTQALPPNQVLTGLALILTLFIMAPVGQQVYDNAVIPYQVGEIDGETAIAEGIAPLKDWMLRNTRESDLLLFARMSNIERPKTRMDIPMLTLMPAFLISEVKTAFQIGFLLFMPFLVIDLVIASVLLSMGMMMLPPVIISFPFKILLFVLVDGWHLLVGSVVQSFH